MPKILVVDDQDVVLSLLCNILQRAGFEVEGRSSFGEACTVISADTDVVITDLDMPHTDDGVRLLEAIRASGFPIKVAAISARICNDDAHKHYRSLGFDLTISKPVKNQVFLSIVQGLLNESTMQD